MRYPIFEPRGRAREFSPLAMDIWKGCDHDCAYCFNKRDGRDFSNLATPIPNIVSNLKVQIAKFGPPKKQVLLTFSGDPYCRAEEEARVTREVLEILCEHDVPVAILTKGGYRCLRDVDLFKKFKSIKIGATMVFSEEKDRKKWEPNATPTVERLVALANIKKHGLQTWASIEPVVIPEQAFDIINNSHLFVDGYKISRLNYHDEAEKVDWKKFTIEVVELLRDLGKSFYIKDDLARLFPDDFFRGNERDKDAMALGEK